MTRSDILAGKIAGSNFKHACMSRRVKGRTPWIKLPQKSLTHQLVRRGNSSIPNGQITF